MTEQAELIEAIMMLLKPFLKEVALNVIEEYKAQIAEKKIEEEDKMISSKAVRELFGICPATLWRWTSTGLVACKKIGGKNYYSQKSVERVMRGELA